MTAEDRLAALFVANRRNAIVAWSLVAVLFVVLLMGGAIERYEPILFSTVAIVIIVAPAVKFRDPTLMPPWIFILLILLPVFGELVLPLPFATTVLPSLAIATLGLLLAVSLHRFSRLRLVPWFAVVLTVLFTLAMGGLFQILRWLSDQFLGTAFLLDGRSQDAINAAVMIELIYVTIAGVVAGVLFYGYLRRIDRYPEERMVVVPIEPVPVEERPDEEILSDKLEIPPRRQTQLARGMQIVLVGILLFGLWELDLAIVTNAVLALGITQIPPILERDYHIAIEPGLVLWVTAAVFLHTLGTAALYDAIGPWDHLTHTLSATVVAAAGYATLRAIDLHTDTINLPRWALWTFTIVFVLAMGVIWELLEFFVDQGALLVGIDPVLAQHGIDDTIVDMLFNTLGAIIVATWGTIYLTQVSESLAEQLQRRLPHQE